MTPPGHWLPSLTSDGWLLFATYSVFGVMAPGLFGFGVAVAIERERGWLALKRVAPMPPVLAVSGIAVSHLPGSSAGGPC